MEVDGKPRSVVAYVTLEGYLVRAGKVPFVSTGSHHHHIFVYLEVDKRNSYKVQVKDMGNRKKDGDRLDLIHLTSTSICIAF